MPVFNEACITTLKDKCLPVCEQRGHEYQDSWHLSNLKTPFLDQVLDVVKDSKIWGPAEKRLVTLSSMCDVKVSRLVGPFKSDTYEDLINYVAVLRTLIDEYLNPEVQMEPVPPMDKSLELAQYLRSGMISVGKDV